ncbi:hypothetical protein ABGB07_32880 [Micromonosporaceae bacterium B7E4]
MSGSFLANVAHKNLAEDYEYETNTMLSGDERLLRNLVEDDEFRATVRVVGVHSYDTQIGGNTTVPLLAIASIKVIRAGPRRQCGAPPTEPLAGSVDGAPNVPVSPVPSTVRVARPRGGGWS